MFHWRGMERVSLKYSTTASFFVSFNLVTNILNLATCSVAVALAGVFAILINKIYKIMEIFE